MAEEKTNFIFLKNRVLKIILEIFVPRNFRRKFFLSTFFRQFFLFSDFWSFCGSLSRSSGKRLIESLVLSL